MAKGEINVLCSDIDTLLTDICKFLSDEIQNGTINDIGRELAQALIQRSKVQLNAISKVASMLDITDPVNESYVDMQSPKSVIISTDTQELYSDVSFEGVSNESVMEDNNIKHYDVCPFDSLPAADLKSGKSGYLYRKERFLFFDQQRKIFVALHQSWLLVYLNEFALKPNQTFDLAEYNAKANTTSTDIKKREESFSLYSTTNLKTYQFTALTSKDMLQWVTAINLQFEVMQTKRSLPPVPPISNDNTDGFESDSSNNYEPLTEYCLKKKQTISSQKNSPALNIIKKPLPLPPRNSTTHVIKKAPSEESMGDYDCVGPEPANSFSNDNEEDSVYDNPTELKQKSNFANNAQVIQTENVNEEEDEIYDYLQDPSQTLTNSQKSNKLPAINEMKNDVVLKDKHKPMLKSRLLSFSNKRKKN